MRADSAVTDQRHRDALNSDLCRRSVSAWRALERGRSHLAEVETVDVAMCPEALERPGEIRLDRHADGTTRGDDAEQDAGPMGGGVVNTSAIVRRSPAYCNRFSATVRSPGSPASAAPHTRERDRDGGQQDDQEGRRHRIKARGPAGQRDTCGRRRPGRAPREGPRAPLWPHLADGDDEGRHRNENDGAEREQQEWGCCRVHTGTMQRVPPADKSPSSIEDSAVSGKRGWGRGRRPASCVATLTALPIGPTVTFRYSTRAV